MKRTQLLIECLCVGFLAAAIGPPASRAVASTEIRRPVPLSAEAAGKVDPMIRLALSLPEKTLRSLAPVA
jgi:hypothetical protein